MMLLPLAGVIIVMAIGTMIISQPTRYYATVTQTMSYIRRLKPYFLRFFEPSPPRPCRYASVAG